MKINQVEELVGITKKNIRFYEEQELVAPNRNPENGYRDYDLNDVERLKKIKLLRMLDVSCEDIRKLISGSITMKDCMDRHSVELTHRQHDIDHMKEMCDLISSQNSEFEAINAGEYLERMNEQVKGGVRFMDVKKEDVTVRKTGAIIAAVAVILVMLGWSAAIVYAFLTEAMPVGVLLVMLIFPSVIIMCVIYALIQRIKEIKGGELDEAGKY